MLVILLAALLLPAPESTFVPQLVLAERPKERAPKPKPAPKPPASDDFDLLPKEATPDSAALARQQEIERQLAKRRTMLRYHQLGGFLTLGSLATTVVLGQLDYLDKYGGHGDTGKVHGWHRWVAVSTTAIFAGTASLAVFAPVPLEKEARLDTATLHKVAMTVAAAGMVTEVVLGIVTASKEGQTSQRDYALAHQIVGYTTLAAAFTGFTVLAF